MLNSKKRAQESVDLNAHGLEADGLPSIGKKLPMVSNFLCRLCNWMKLNSFHLLGLFSVESVDLFGKVLFGQLKPIRNRLPLRYPIELRCGCAKIRCQDANTKRILLGTRIQ